MKNEFMVLGLYLDNIALPNIIKEITVREGLIMSDEYYGNKILWVELKYETLKMIDLLKKKDTINL